jgi:hypothetical protein
MSKRLFKQVTNETIRNAFFLCLGTLCTLWAFVNFAYRIPRVTDQISELDASVAAAEMTVYQVKSFETMQFVSANSRMMLDKIVTRKLYSKAFQEFVDDEARVLRTIIILLHWPENPPLDYRQKLNDLNINQLDSIRIVQYPLFTDKVNLKLQAKKERVDEKNSLLLWGIVLQVLGIFFTQIGTILNVIKR